jgi:hypothetical protein
MKSIIKKIMLYVAICLSVNLVGNTIINNYIDEQEPTLVDSDYTMSDDQSAAIDSKSHFDSVHMNDNLLTDNKDEAQSPFGDAHTQKSTLDQIFQDIDDHAMNSGSMSEDQRTLYALCMQGDKGACTQFIAYSKQISNNYEMVGQMFDER